MTTFGTKTLADDAFGCFGAAAVRETSRMGRVDYSSVVGHAVNHLGALVLCLSLCADRGQAGISLSSEHGLGWSSRSGLGGAGTADGTVTGGCASAFSEADKTVRVGRGTDARVVHIHVLALAHLVIDVASTGPGSPATNATSGRSRAHGAALASQNGVPLRVEIATGGDRGWSGGAWGQAVDGSRVAGSGYALETGKA